MARVARSSRPARTAAGQLGAADPERCTGIGLECADVQLAQAALPLVDPWGTTRPRGTGARPLNIATCAGPQARA